MISESHKLAISNGLKRFFANGGKNGMLGKHSSSFQKRRISETHKNIPLSEEHKLKLSLSKKGIPLSKSHKKKLRVSQRNRFDNGGIVWNKGLIGYASRKKIYKGTRSYYSGLHRWIKKYLIKIECENCKCTENLEYSNKSGKYKKDISDWQIMCKLCHASYDQSFSEKELEIGRV